MKDAAAQALLEYAKAEEVMNSKSAAHYSVENQAKLRRILKVPDSCLRIGDFLDDMRRKAILLAEPVKSE